MDRGAYPYVVWDGNDTDAIFDPVTEEHIRKYSTIDAFYPEAENYDITVKDGMIVGPHNLQKPKNLGPVTDDAKVVGPNGEEMVKYPSGYWDITLSELGIKPVTEM